MLDHKGWPVCTSEGSALCIIAKALSRINDSFGGILCLGVGSSKYQRCVLTMYRFE